MCLCAISVDLKCAVYIFCAWRLLAGCSVVKCSKFLYLNICIANGVLLFHKVSVLANIYISKYVNIQIQFKYTGNQL